MSNPIALCDTVTLDVEYTVPQDERVLPAVWQVRYNNEDVTHLVAQALLDKFARGVEEQE